MNETETDEPLPVSSPPPFLNVERSFLGAIWRERLDAAGHGHALALMQQHGLPDLLARVLAGRGVTADTCQGHLRPTLRALMPEPDAVADMAAATARLAQAITGRETVAIFGDYDVDGATAAALLGGYLRAAGLDPLVHIPDRLTEGYGPNAAAIGKLARAGATLLVTVDCGTGSPEALSEAKRLGLDTVVIDHHRAAAALPPAVAIVNANRQDDLSGLGHLCAAGMVFVVLVALQRRLRQADFWTAGRPAPDLLLGLDLVALGTVADVVPLTGLNRAFVTQGLTVMRHRARPGLRALLDVAGADGPPTPYHLGFLLGPRINAGGRIGDAGLGARLLMTDDPVEAVRIAADLDRLNRERRVIEGAAVDAAEAEAVAAALDAAADGRTLVCAGDWHPGVVGLVAARLRERFNRPVFALAVADGRATGSGRSIPGVDLGRVVHAAVAAGVLLKGGGHAMAAGVTLEAAAIPAFRAFVDATLGSAVAAARAVSAFAVDTVLTAGGVSAELVGSLDQAGPYGAGNPEPVVAFASHRLKAVQPVGTDHLRLTVEAGDGARLTAIAFRAEGGALGEGLRAAVGRPVHLAGTLALNRHGGAGRAELRLLDAALA